MAIRLAALAIAILAFSDHNQFSQTYGIIMLPVALLFVLYAYVSFRDRGRMLRARLPGPYADKVAPILLTCLLMCCLIVTFGIKLRAMYVKEDE